MTRSNANVKKKNTIYKKPCRSCAFFFRYIVKYFLSLFLWHTQIICHIIILIHSIVFIRTNSKNSCKTSLSVTVYVFMVSELVLEFWLHVRLMFVMFNIAYILFIDVLYFFGEYHHFFFNWNFFSATAK